MEYLESHYEQPLAPGSLADIAGLHPARFARLVKRIYRLTPNQLILQTRLSAAAKLLTDTKDSVADVACACGFYDHSAFTRAFRSATKMTPTQFRSMLRETAVASQDEPKPEETELIRLSRTSRQQSGLSRLPALPLMAWVLTGKRSYRQLGDISQGTC